MSFRAERGEFSALNDGGEQGDVDSEWSHPRGFLANETSPYPLHKGDLCILRFAQDDN